MKNDLSPSSDEENYPEDRFLSFKTKIDLDENEERRKKRSELMDLQTKGCIGFFVFAEIVEKKS